MRYAEGMRYCHIILNTEISDLNFIHFGISEFQFSSRCLVIRKFWQFRWFNSLTPKLNPSAQRCMTRFFTGDFASWTVNFVNICVKNQQIQQLFIQFINYVW
jgi:hypothetical protein